MPMPKLARKILDARKTLPRRMNKYAAMFTRIEGSTNMNNGNLLTGLVDKDSMGNATDVAIITNRRMELSKPAMRVVSSSSLNKGGARNFLKLFSI